MKAPGDPGSEPGLGVSGMELRLEGGGHCEEFVIGLRYRGEEGLL